MRCSSDPVSLQNCKEPLHISDLAALAEILSTAEGTFISIDLAGKTVATGSTASAPDLTVKKGGKLCLSNGGLSMPPGCCLKVDPGAALELNSIRVSGQGMAGHGLVTVKGAGADARLTDCHVTGQGRTEGSSDAVLVADGGTGSLVKCTLTAAAGDGLSVRGAGSSADATDCMTSKCRANGYAACEGGLLTATRCVASKNKKVGFLASGAGSTLQAGPACRAFGNGAQGFNAEGMAKLTCGKGCTATGNAGSGFRAQGPGALLEAGPECRAEGSGGNGFFAFEGGKLIAGEGCIASGSTWAGFIAREGASELTVGVGCQSTGNSAQGFNAEGGAKLVAGDSCVAR
jgi:hypothetical protein